MCGIITCREKEATNSIHLPQLSGTAPQYHFDLLCSGQKLRNSFINFHFWLEGDKSICVLCLHCNLYIRIIIWRESGKVSLTSKNRRKTGRNWRFLAMLKARQFSPTDYFTTARVNHIGHCGGCVSVPLSFLFSKTVVSVVTVRLNSRQEQQLTRTTVSILSILTSQSFCL